MANVDDNIAEEPNSDIENLLKNVQDMGDLYFVAQLVLSKLEPSHKNGMVAELSYLLDTQSFINLLWYFEGETIRIPTRDELKEVLQMMSIYYHYQVLGKTWKDALIDVGIPYDSHLYGRMWNRYHKFMKTLDNVELPKKLRRPDVDSKLAAEGGSSND